MREIEINLLERAALAVSAYSAAYYRTTKMARSLIDVVLAILPPSQPMAELLLTHLKKLSSKDWGKINANDYEQFFSVYVADGASALRVEHYTDALVRNAIFISEFISLARAQLKEAVADKESGLAANARKLAKELQLNQEEEAIFTLFVLCAECRSAKEVLRHIAVESPSDAAPIIGRMLGLPEESIITALKPDAALRRLRLIQPLPTESTTDLVDVLQLPTMIKNILVGDTNDLLGTVCPSASPSELSIADYQHVSTETAQLVALLRAVLRERPRGINVLIYGPPGTGKSQFARAVSAEVNASLREVTFQTTEGDTVDRDSRYVYLRIAQALLEKRTETVFLFDEAEDAFPADGQREAHSKVRSKAWINDLLENNAAPVIWVTNSIGQMDPAYLRRFQFHLELKEPTPAARERMIRSSLDGLSVSAEQVDALTKRKTLVPGLLASAAKFSKMVAAETSEDPYHLLSRWLDRADVAMGVKGEGSAKRTTPTTYSEEFLNLDTQFQVDKIIVSLKSRRQGTLCFYGPPGTGKTMFAEHIAEEMSAPLMIRKASDLVSKYVGETEQNLAKMFEEAADSKSVLLLDEADSFMQDRRGAQRTWEVTEVNEMLQQMERFNGVFICTTNLLDRVDEAALRRFSFKVRFMALSLSQRIKMFASECLGDSGAIVSSSIIEKLQAMDCLTPGDFATVRRQEILFDERLSPDAFLKQLKDEHSAKPSQRESKKIGF